MNDRISLILKLKNISATKFADEIDVQRSSISHILSERNKPSLEFIQKILKTYPEISPEWLISGKGAMMKNPDLFEQIEPKIIIEKEESLKTHSLNKVESSVKETLKNIEIENIPIQNKQVPIQMEDKIISENTGNQKKIEKIVVFYSNNTFKEYLPE